MEFLVFGFRFGAWFLLELRVASKSWGTECSGCLDFFFLLGGGGCGGQGRRSKAHSFGSKADLLEMQFDDPSVRGFDEAGD